jgi:hypothetical protein
VQNKLLQLVGHYNVSVELQTDPQLRALALGTAVQTAAAARQCSLKEKKQAQRSLLKRGSVKLLSAGCAVMMRLAC